MQGGGDIGDRNRYGEGLLRGVGGRLKVERDGASRDDGAVGLQRGDDGSGKGVSVCRGNHPMKFYGIYPRCGDGKGVAA